MTETNPAKRFGKDLAAFGEQIDRVVDDLYADESADYRQETKERLLERVAAELVAHAFAGADEESADAAERKKKW